MTENEGGTPERILLLRSIKFALLDIQRDVSLLRALAVSSFALIGGAAIGVAAFFIIANILQ